MANLEGAMLSDYLLLECISRGSVADVYHAQQNDASHYEVAIKVFRPGYAGREAFRAYFMYEAEKIGQFDHPHILPFIEYGEGEGLLYAVTPFVKSGTLEDLLKKVGGKFSAMQALPIMQHLCAGVQYAHEHDVIHGNIKPRNVFVANDGRMLLADFGIARGYSDGQQPLAKIDWGAIQYAAPEQSLGLMRRASDIYSLGALCFRLLTGSPVFSGQTPVEVLLKHVRQQAPSVRTLEAGISEEVAEVLQKALQKRSDARYATALELSCAFADAVAVAPVATPLARPATIPLTRPEPHTPMPLAHQESVTPPPAVPLSWQRPARTRVLSPPPEPHTASESAFADRPTSPLPGVSPEQEAWRSPPGGPQSSESVQQVSVRPDTQERSGGRLLPLLVVALLVLGLLGALLSSLFLPTHPAPGASHAGSLSAGVSLAESDTGGKRWPN
ncbi:MAG TPA: protein kinase [Ktedonobacteraceae bacterium]|jgi:serine/threonine-protein kinase